MRNPLLQKVLNETPKSVTGWIRRYANRVVKKKRVPRKLKKKLKSLTNL